MDDTNAPNSTKLAAQDQFIDAVQGPIAQAQAHAQAQGPAAQGPAAQGPANNNAPVGPNVPIQPPQQLVPAQPVPAGLVVPASWVVYQN